MQWSAILRLLAVLLYVVAIAMLTAIPWAWVYDGGQVILAFFLSAGITAVIATILYLRGQAPESIFPREALAFVTLGWIAVGILGSLPYIFAGVLKHPVPAIFESVSGFTTTGATVFTDVESLPRAINWWRTLTHWLGGMGIVVLFIAVLPRLGVGAKHLFRSEVPGPITDNLKPKLRETATLLWKIYLGLTLAETLLLMLAGMDLFEALCHSFATLATGGFSTRNASIGSFDSAWIEAVIVLFMILAGVNFSLYYVAISRRNWRQVFRDPELRAYLTLLAVGTLAISGAIASLDVSVLESLRRGIFQTVSIQTTTGFGTDNFNLYPSMAKFLLVSLMFIGGSAGSTGGGMKVVRMMIIFKVIYAELYRTFRPQAVRAIKLGGKPLPADMVSTVMAFFAIGIVAFLGGSIFVSLFGIDMVTSFSATAACLWNIGPGLEQVGSIEHYGWMPMPVQAMLSMMMILGRLELYTVLVLLLPAFWRK